MNEIEFLARTDSRHLQAHIQFKIKEALQHRVDEVSQRRERLRNLLEAEKQQQEEELAYLYHQRVLEAKQRRLDWEETANFQRAEAEKEFLRLKQIQRELLNCEEMRPSESKKITEDTKRVQLIQIAEKRGLELKEKEIDQIWLEASHLMEKEKEKQELYERHLKDIIAGKTVEVLREQMEHRRSVKELEEQEKREENAANERAKNEELTRIDFEARQRQGKKLEEHARQVAELRALHEERRLQASQQNFFEVKDKEFQATQLEHDKDMARLKKEAEKECFNQYMQYAKEQQSEVSSRDKQLDTALTAFGRRTQAKPVPKRPYQKSVR